MRVLVLDAPILGLVTNPKASPENLACKAWLDALMQGGWRVVVPEIADYEVRRELLRASKTAGLARLDALEASVEYAALSTAEIRHAALLWAQARQQGQPTADSKALDGDVILAAQALGLGVPLSDLTVATTNVGHLSLFVPAAEWRSIAPQDCWPRPERHPCRRPLFRAPAATRPSHPRVMHLTPAAAVPAARRCPRRRRLPAQ